MKAHIEWRTEDEGKQQRTGQILFCVACSVCGQDWTGWIAAAEQKPRRLCVISPAFSACFLKRRGRHGVNQSLPNRQQQGNTIIRKATSATNRTRENAGNDSFVINWRAGDVLMIGLSLIHSVRTVSSMIGKRYLLLNWWKWIDFHSCVDRSDDCFDQFLLLFQP